MKPVTRFKATGPDWLWDWVIRIATIHSFDVGLQPSFRNKKHSLNQAFRAEPDFLSIVVGRGALHCFCRHAAACGRIRIYEEY
jgi:hypothetical protein